jgi:hypothetical protein
MDAAKAPLSMLKNATTYRRGKQHNRPSPIGRILEAPSAPIEALQ